MKFQLSAATIVASLSLDTTSTVEAFSLSSSSSSSSSYSQQLQYNNNRHGYGIGTGTGIGTSTGTGFGNLPATGTGTRTSTTLTADTTTSYFFASSTSTDKESSTTAANASGTGSGSTGSDYLSSLATNSGSASTSTSTSRSASGTGLSGYADRLGASNPSSKLSSEQMAAIEQKMEAQVTAQVTTMAEAKVTNPDPSSPSTVLRDVEEKATSLVQGFDSLGDNKNVSGPSLQSAIQATTNSNTNKNQRQQQQPLMDVEKDFKTLEESAELDVMKNVVQQLTSSAEKLVLQKVDELMGTDGSISPSSTSSITSTSGSSTSTSKFFKSSKTVGDPPESVANTIVEKEKEDAVREETERNMERNMEETVEEHIAMNFGGGSTDLNVNGSGSSDNNVSVKTAAAATVTTGATTTSAPVPVPTPMTPPTSTSSSSSSPQDVVTSTQSLYNLNQAQTSSLEQKVETTTDYRAQEAEAELSVMSDVESTAEKLVLAAVAQGKKIFDSISQFAAGGGGSRNKFFKSSSTSSSTSTITSSLFLSSPSSVPLPSNVVDVQVVPETIKEEGVKLLSPAEIQSLEKKAEDDVVSSRADEIAAEAKVIKEVEMAVEGQVEYNAVNLAEGRTGVDEVSQNDRVSKSDWFVSSTTQSIITESQAGAGIGAVGASQQPSSYPPTATATSALSAEAIRAIESSAEAKVMREIELAAEKMVEEGAAALAEGSTFQTKSTFGGSTTSNYFFKPSTTVDEPVITTVFPAPAPTPTPVDMGSYEKKAEEDVMINKADEIAAEMKVEKEVESKAELSAVRLAEGMASLDEISQKEGLSHFFKSSTTTSSMVNAGTIVKDSSMGNDVADVTESKIKTQYKPFTPLPKVESSKGSYLEALSGTGSSTISGTGSGQSNYLDTLASQNTRPSSGSGLLGYVDGLGVTKSITFTTLKETPSTVAKTDVQQVEQKMFTPPPQPKPGSSEGNYLDALSGSGSGEISGTGTGQSSYLNALTGQNTKPLVGSGIGGYIDSVGGSKPMSFSESSSSAIPADINEPGEADKLKVEPLQQQPVVASQPKVESPKGNYLDALSGTGSGMISGSTSGQSDYMSALSSSNVNTLSGSGVGGYLDSVNEIKEAEEIPIVSSSIYGLPESDESTEENVIQFQGSYFEGVTTTSICKLGISSTRTQSKTYVQNSLMGMRPKAGSDNNRQTNLKLYMSSSNSMETGGEGFGKKSGSKRKKSKRNKKDSFDEIEFQTDSIGSYSSLNFNNADVSNSVNPIPKVSTEVPQTAAKLAYERQLESQRQLEEEAAKKVAEQNAARIEAARIAAEEVASRLAAEEEVAKRVAKEEAARIAAQEAETAKKAVEKETARIAAQEEAARIESARIAALEETAKKAAEEEARIADQEKKAAEEEAARIAAEEEATRKAAEEEAARIAAEEKKAARIAAEQEAAKRAAEEEAARIAAEQEATRKAAEEEAVRIAAEQEAAKRAAEEEAARLEAAKIAAEQEAAAEKERLRILSVEAESKQRGILQAKLAFDAKNRQRKIAEEARLAERERILALSVEAESKQRGILEAKLIFDAKDRERKITEKLRLAERERFRQLGAEAEAKQRGILQTKLAIDRKALESRKVKEAEEKIIAEEEERARIARDMKEDTSQAGTTTKFETSSTVKTSYESTKSSFVSRDNNTVMTKERTLSTAITAEENDDEERLWQVKKKCKTQRIMEKAQVEGQTGGAGGVSTWEAFLRAEENWKKLRDSEPFEYDPKLKRSVQNGVPPPFQFVTTDGALGNPASWKTLRDQYSSASDGEKEGEKYLDFDVVVCGGTLGIFIATALQIKGHNVCVIEGGELRGREQEWNISMKEMLELVELKVLTMDDLDAAIKTEFPACRSGFKNEEVPTKGSYFENGVGYECFTPDVLNLGVAPSILIENVKQRFIQSGGIVKEKTPIKGIVISDNYGGAVDIGDKGEPVTTRLILDCMGNNSPISRQQRYGLKPDGVCCVVGSCAGGYDKETNILGDIIYTNSEIQNKGEHGSLQYFWEAFPVNIGRGKEPGTSDVKTTYMFTYLDADKKRPDLITLMEDYWTLLPKYQPSIKDPEKDLDVKRVLFAYFPTYRDSPLKPGFSRLLAVGDASGIQSPLSFGGFGALTRHLDRVSGAISEALRNDCLHKDDLSMINPYTPNLSATWMFQKAMSVSMGQNVDPKFVNRLLATNFQGMDDMGIDTIKPFLQDVVRVDGLVGSLGRSFVADPGYMPTIVSHVGIPRLVDWLGHVSMMGLYTTYHASVTPVITPFVDKMQDPRQRFRWRRRMEAWKFGSGSDYILPRDEEKK